MYDAAVVDGCRGRILADIDRALLFTRTQWSPLEARLLSVTGVGSVLIKGNLIGRLTLHEGGSSLRRTALGLRVLGPAPIRKTVDAATVLRRALALRHLTAAVPDCRAAPGRHLTAARAGSPEG